MARERGVEWRTGEKKRGKEEDRGDMGRQGEWETGRGQIGRWERDR